MIAVVSGREIVTVVPAPGVERTRRLPFISSTARFTASMPTPRPEMSETTRAVLKPGRKMKERICSALALGASSLADEALLQRLSQDCVAVQPAAVVGDLDADVVPVLVGAQADRPRLRLARRAAVRRRLQAVVHRVAHQVHQRLADAVDHLLVDLRLLAEHLQHDGLAAGLRQVAHHAAEPVEYAGNRAASAPS